MSDHDVGFERFNEPGGRGLRARLWWQDAPVPRHVYLHIGAPKTGTTALQSRLHRNAASLLEHDAGLAAEVEDQISRLATTGVDVVGDASGS